MTSEGPDRREDPYVGPVSFRLGDPLYGRDREREDLLDLLIAERIVLLYSPSGAGKSSLIEAALVPALRDAAFEVLPTIRVTHALPPEPGMPVPRNRYVLGVLLSLEEGVSPDRQRPVAELATLTLREYLTAYADRDERPGNEVLIFDQFEEVLTADPTDEPAKHAFFKELGDVLRDRGHWALFSMREDFLAALDPYLKYLPTRLRTTFRLDLLSVSEALEAIRRPAKRAGVNFTEDAARQLVDDLRIVRVQRPTGVTEVLGSYVEPVQLQVACHLLWSTLPLGATEITRTDVEALGRVDQALGGYYADRVQAAAASTGVSERVIRDWFEESLITPQGLRSQVLQGPQPSSEAGHRLLGELLDAHLVRAETRRQATWYELAHDRLIEPVRRDNAAWRIRHLSSMERSALLWEQEGKPDRLLLLGTDLAAAQQDEAVRTGALTNRQREFLEASRRADEQARRDIETAAALQRSARRLRITAVLSTVLAVASVVLLVVVGGLLALSDQARDEADAARSVTSLLLEAQSRLDGDQDRAVALAAEGAEMYGDGGFTEQVRDVLYQAVASPVSLALRGQAGSTRAAAISEDDRAVVAAGSEDIRVWERNSGRLRAELPLEKDEVVNSLDVASDGRTVFAGMEDGTLLVWDVESSDPLRWEEGTGYVWAVSRSPDGERFASVGIDTTVQVWGVDGTLQITIQDAETTYANAVAFSPDGTRLATAGDNAEVVLWDARTGVETERLPLPEDAYEVEFGSDGDSLATITASSVTVWDLDSWEPRYPPFEEAPGTPRSLDEDFARVLSVDTEGAVSVYDLASGLETGSSSVPGASVWGAAFDAEPDRVLVLGYDIDPAFWNLRPAGSFAYLTAAAVTESRIYQAWSDGTLWVSGVDAQSGESIVPGIGSDDVAELAADRAGARLAAVTIFGQVRVWDTTTGTELVVLEPEDYPFTDVDITPDGALIITGDEAGQVVAWDAETGEKLNDAGYGTATEPSAAKPRSVSEIQVSPDGGTVFAALMPSYTPDEPIALVAPLSGSGVGSGEEMPMPEGWEAESVLAAAFDADGKNIVLGTETGRIARADTRDGTLVWDVENEHEGPAQEILVAGDGRSVLSMGGDNKVAILDAADGTEIHRVATVSKPLAAVLGGDGEDLVLVTEDDGVVAVGLTDTGLLELVDSKIIYRGECDADC